MFDVKEAAFLRTVAEGYDDNTPRLVFADWLDEHGQSPRAEFVRVQCELASAKLGDKRRQTLRVRERELLDAHRHEWCEMFALPVEDVSFARGLIDGMRISRLHVKEQAWEMFATLRELDLSGLQLGDAGLAEFARTAHLPALRKLMLNDNAITNVAALASAEGLPQLDTLYLFQNPIDGEARAALEQSEYFQLANLDLGERADGYCMSPGEAEMARRKCIRTQLLPVVTKHFQTYERLQSAMLYVAQYWADEADDAVHAMLIVSERLEPTLDGVGSGEDPNVPNTHIPQKYGEGSSSEVYLWDAGAHWDDNGSAIPLWAAFAPEGGSQEYQSFSEVYLPAVMFYRHGGYEILPMCRPHLDGVRPQFEE